MTTDTIAEHVIDNGNHVPRINNANRFWTKARILAAQLYADGESTRAIAKKTGKSTYWLYTTCLNRDEFKDKVREYQDAVREALLNHSITEKRERLRRLEEMLRQADGWQAENGLSEITVRYDEEGNEVGRTVKFNKNLIDTKRGILQDVAKEMDQLPRSGITVNDNRNLTVINLLTQLQAEVPQLPEDESE